ncbi:MAG: LD-carboxypeptidase [Rhodothermia bacterium]|nr:LD-carboxypeptidase [Rhodothermia bacterium]
MTSFTRRSFLKTAPFLAYVSSHWLSAPRHTQVDSPVVKPPRLKAGDTVGIVSPSGITYDPDQVNIFSESLAAIGLQARVGDHALDRWGYLAGADADRAGEINRMFEDTGIAAIFTLAGGWGAARLLPLIDFDLVRRNPKIVLGFSDVTSLLLAMYARSGLVTFHGPTGNSTWNSFTTNYVKRLLFDAQQVVYENPTDSGDNLTQVANRIWTITPGTVRGRLIGGNLTVLSSIIGSKFLPEWDDHILFLEDVGEDVYRIDRMLTQLKLAGVLDKLAGFVFGRCSRCQPDSSYSSFTLKEVLADHVAPLGIPAFHGSMIGHIRDKFTVPVGAMAEIDAASGRIKLTESAVA